MLAEAELRSRVEDYLRQSAALEEIWKRPITAAALQDEVQRMADSTRRPEMLRELFAALDNDPLRIAECLARPNLADRLICEYHARDERFQRGVLAHARADLARVHDPEDLKHTTGNYVETTWRLKTVGHGGRADARGHHRHRDGGDLARNDGARAREDRVEAARTDRRRRDPGRGSRRASQGRGGFLRRAGRPAAG